MFLVWLARFPPRGTGMANDKKAIVIVVDDTKVNTCKRRVGTAYMQKKCVLLAFSLKLSHSHPHRIKSLIMIRVPSFCA